LAIAGLAAPDAVAAAPGALPATTPGVLGFVPAAPTAGIGGLATAGNATVAPAPGGFAPVPAGRGGREIRMVSLRKSAGGLAIPGIAGIACVPPFPGTGGAAGLGAAGIPGIAGTGGFGNAGAPGTAGLGGGASFIVSFFRPVGGAVGGLGGFGGAANRTVSFLTPGNGGTNAGDPGGLFAEGIPGGPGGFGTAGRGGAPGGLGTLGGKGNPSAI